jgi:hypothetical protein
MGIILARGLTYHEIAKTEGMTSYLAALTDLSLQDFILQSFYSWREQSSTSKRQECNAQIR